MKLLFSPLIYICTLLLLGLSLSAQSFYPGEWIEHSDGLSDQKVNLISQDSSGFIWLASRQGLDRYDGLRFKHYSTKESSPATLLNPTIKGMVFTKKQELLMIGDKGIEVLDTEKDTILYRVYLDQHSKAHGLKKAGGKIWLSLHRNDSTYILRYRKKLQFDTIIAAKGDSRPWNFHINSDGFIYYFDKRKRFTCHHLESKQTTILDSNTFKQNRWTHGLNIFSDAKDRIWVNDVWWNKGPKIAVWDANSRQFHFPETPPGRIRKKGRLDSTQFIFIDSKSYNSFLLDTETLKMKPYLQYDKATRGIFRDRQDNFWIFNDVKGVLKSPHQSKGFFQHLLSKEKSKDGTLRGMRDMLELPNGHVLLSTNNGLFIHSRSEDQIWPVTFINYTGRIEEPQQAYRLHLDEKNKRLRIMGFRQPVDVGQFDWNTRTLQEELAPLSAQHLICALDYDDRMWFMGEKNLYPVLTEQLSSNSQANEWPSASKNLHAYHFIKTKNEHLWLATNQGLYHFDSTGVFIDRYHMEHPSIPLASNTIYDVLEDKDGTLWMGTPSGLHQFHPEQQILNIYTRKDGLLNDIVCSILEDDQGYLWLGTFYGLSRFDPQEKSFYNYLEEDGIPSNEFNISARLKTSDGRLYFGGVNGAITFDPAQFKPLNNQSKLVLTSYSTYAKNGEHLEHFEKNLSDLHRIRLPYNNKYFRFEFALLDFINPQKNTYSWYLEGFEKSWREPTRLAEAQYNNIPAGKYTFRIKAANYNGTWSNQQIAIEVIVQQAFYKTIWFISLCIISLLFIIYAWYRYRLLQLLQIERMRNKIARDLHDDIGGALTRLSVQSQLIEATAKEPEVIQNFSTVLIQTISKLRDVVWSIDSGHDKVEDLINRMKDYAYDTLHPQEIRYTFDIRHINYNKKITPSFRQNIYLIFKESINNIIRHSNATVVKISLNNNLDQKQFEMCIEDNGRNTKEKKLGGMGLKSMQQRAMQLGGKLQVEAGDKGFKVKVCCPGL